MISSMKSLHFACPFTIHVRSVFPVLYGAALCILFWVSASKVEAAGEAPALAFSDTPTAVQKAIKANIGNGTLTSIEKTEEDGAVAYEVEFRRNGQDRDMEIGEDGKVLKIEMTLPELPLPVQQAIQKQLGEDTLDAIEKTFDLDGITYDVEITTKKGPESRFSISESGVLLEVELDPSAVPVEVQKTVSSQVGKGTLTTLTKIIDGGAVTYEAEFSKDGKDGAITVGNDGKLLRVQITLEEASPEAQKTIKEKVGNGRIVSVYKSFVKRDKVLPYEVESIKDGKAFDFSVGPKGRFLGMDD